MRPGEIHTYIKHPHLLTREHVGELQQMVKDFPYFQAAHLLLSLASKKWDASVYQQSLKKTAIVSVNRAHLFDLLHRDEQEVTAMQTESSTTVTAVSEPAVQEATAKEEELHILKAAELSVDRMQEKEAEKKDEGSDQLEKEISKQVVVAFVEKEILKTPEVLTKPDKEEKPESFGDWLSYLKKNNGKESYGEIAAQVNLNKQKRDQESKEKPKESDPVSERKKRNQAIMDKVIEKNPGLIRAKEEPKFYIPEAKAKESLLENEHLITETLARIYALQGNVNKAVRAYEILSLKYPQKSAYFASLIEKLKNNQ